MAVTRAQRAKFLEQQRALFKAKTNYVIRTIKEERFQTEDDCSVYKAAFYADRSVDFGILMSLTTRAKIYYVAMEALKKLRNFDSDIDISRLPTLIRVHTHQLRTIGTKNAEANIQFCREMLDSIEQNHKWLLLIKP